MQKIIHCSRFIPEAILFDFDGTLVDSAPDLIGSVNELRQEHGLTMLPYDDLRQYATYGVRSLLKAALDLELQDDDYESNRKRFLAIYDQRKLWKSKLFDGVLELLIALERRGIGWGIVTNKHSRFAEPMIAELLRDRAFTPSAVVCGDTTSTPKPHPAPLLLAAQDSGFAAERCWYVGDGQSDIEASHAAGMYSVLASYGYISNLAATHHWGAAAEIAKPIDLLNLLPS